MSDQRSARSSPRRMPVIAAIRISMRRTGHQSRTACAPPNSLVRSFFRLGEQLVVVQEPQRL